MSSPGKVDPSPANTRQNHSQALPPREMLALVNAFDWASTPLGPIDYWDAALLSTVRTVLAADLPMQLFWGDEMITIYNDALRPAFAEKHPAALGKPAREVWGEVWHSVGEQLEGVLEGRAVNFRAVPFAWVRKGVLEQMYWDYSYSPIFAADGRIAGILNVAIEVTDAVRSREKLLESESRSSEMATRLSQILTATTDAIMFVDRDWTVTYMNRAAEAMYGASKAFVGRNAWECLPAAVYEGSPYVEHFNRAMNEETSGRFEAYYPDPLDIWIQLEVYATPDGIVTFSRDISEQKRTADELEQNRQKALRSERQLQVITDALPSYLSYLDADLRYVRVNRTYEHWFKRPAEELRGKTLAQVLGPDAAAIVEAQMQRALAGERRQFEYNLQIEGEQRVLSVVHIPDVGENGKVQGIIVQGQDITDRKRTEAALLQSEKLAAVGRLATSIAHEINNPLESVTNLLFLAQNCSDPAELRGYLDTAERELRRVSVISNQTLRFHKQSTRPRPVTAGELFESVLSIYQGKLINSRVTVVRNRQTAECVECFDGEIRQVLSNLVGNAIDAMQAQGGRLTLRSSVSTNWQAMQRGLAVTVADNGPGMPPEVKGRAFDAFYTTKDINGTGLGLWISKEIVDRHRGTLRFRSSQEGNWRGTVFRLFLPFEPVNR